MVLLDFTYNDVAFFAACGLGLAPHYNDLNWRLCYWTANYGVEEHGAYASLLLGQF